MARKTSKELNEKIKLLRWLRWQCLRKNKEYQSDIENLLEIAKKKAKKPPLKSGKDKNWFPETHEDIEYLADKTAEYARQQKLIKAYLNIVWIFTN
ncbi:hypothetical protein KJ693_10915 [bacterium]|nr:hypothetical protein [bacterium]